MIKRALLVVTLPLLLVSCHQPPQETQKTYESLPSSESISVAPQSSESTESSWIDSEIGIERTFELSFIQPEELGWTFEYFSMELSLGCLCRMEWKSFHNGEFVEEGEFETTYEIHHNIEWGYFRNDVVFLQSDRPHEDPFNTRVFNFDTSLKSLWSCQSGGPHDGGVRIDGQSYPIFLVLTAQQ